MVFPTRWQRLSPLQMIRQKGFVVLALFLSWEEFERRSQDLGLEWFEISEEMKWTLLIDKWTISVQPACEKLEVHLRWSAQWEWREANALSWRWCGQCTCHVAKVLQKSILAESCRVGRRNARDFYQFGSDLQHAARQNQEYVKVHLDWSSKIMRGAWTITPLLRRRSKWKSRTQKKSQNFK